MLQRRTGLQTVLPGLLRDAVGPYVVYLVLHAAGWSSLRALVAGAVVSAVLVALDLARSRRFNALSAVVLLALLLAIAVTAITGDARVALARDAVITAGLGVAFLLSLAGDRPLMFHLMRSVSAGTGPDGASAFEDRVRRSARLGASLRVVTAVWGAGLLVDAGLRLLLAMTLPVSTAATAVTILTVATVLVLLSWMQRYLRSHA